MGVQFPGQSSDNINTGANGETKAVRRSPRFSWSRIIQFIRLVMTRLNLKTIGQIAVIVSASAALAQLFVGQRFPLQMITAEHLYKTILPQQRTTVSFFNTCIVGNDGHSPAEAVNITLRPTSSVVFDDYYVTDVQGLWRVVSGGIGSGYLTIESTRLHPGQMLTVTVTTKTPTQITCIADSKVSQADEQIGPSTIGLLKGGFGVTIGMLILIAILLIARFPINR